MIVAGGTYREEVTTPVQFDELGGSAFRAAAAVRAQTLVTAVEPEAEETLQSAAAVLSFEVVNVGRDKAVGFDYLASFLDPTIRGAGACLSNDLVVDGDGVLAFGMVEAGRITISAKRLVYDPQSVDDELFETLSQARFDHLAICANVDEVNSFGNQDSVESSAARLRDVTGAEVVIVKAGARGCFVITASDSRWLSAAPTAAVRKLGSGDVFSAVFARLWTSGWDAIDAAERASIATGWWCGGVLTAIPEEFFLHGEFSSPPLVPSDGHAPFVYLAGPFFTIAERWLVNECRRFLIQAGADVFSPIHEVGLGGAEVALQDLNGLKKADAVFALLDGWDAGTLFEIGWAVRAGIPCVAFASQPDPIRSTMLTGTSVELLADITTAMYRAIWAGIDNGRRPSAAS